MILFDHDFDFCIDWLIQDFFYCYQIKIYVSWILCARPKIRTNLVATVVAVFQTSAPLCTQAAVAYVWYILARRRKRAKPAL